MASNQKATKKPVKKPAMKPGGKKPVKKQVKKPVKKKTLPGVVAGENKYSNKGGRPAKYETPEELSAEVDSYFKYCEGEFHIEKKTVTSKKKKVNKFGEDDTEGDHVETVDVKVWDRYPEPYTVTGLVLFLGFAHRQSLDDYEERSQFSDIIKRARSRVEHGYELRLFHDRPVGAIFALTNMGWKNQQQVDHTSKGERLGATDLSKLTDEELSKLAELQLKVRGE